MKLGELILRFVIPLKPITKKNSQQIRYKYVKGRKVPFIAQSDAYQDYEHKALHYLPKTPYPIDVPVNIKATYYVPDKRVRDLTNLNGSLHDILVKGHILQDDNWTKVPSTDGSRVKLDKQNPRTEVTITVGEGDPSVKAK